MYRTRACAVTLDMTVQDAWSKIYIDFYAQMEKQTFLCQQHWYKTTRLQVTTGNTGVRVRVNGHLKGEPGEEEPMLGICGGIQWHLTFTVTLITFERNSEKFKDLVNHRLLQF